VSSSSAIDIRGFAISRASKRIYRTSEYRR
jgi:hypothetical protein